jgi:putative transposase
MARLARIVVPGLPCHVTQRGNGRQRVFFADPDYAAYRDWLAEAAHEARVSVWAWCLMSNHVHLIVVPQDEDGLRRVLARVHHRYAGLIHARRRRTGHFWQGRYGAVAMDEDHLAAAYRYVNLNPVRARLVERSEDWPWSSARALLGVAEDGLTDLAPARQRFSRFADLLEADEDEGATARLTQRRERRPAGRLGRVPRRAGNQDTPPPPRPQAGAEAKGRRSGRGPEVKCTVTVTAGGFAR